MVHKLVESITSVFGLIGHLIPHSAAFHPSPASSLPACNMTQQRTSGRMDRRMNGGLGGSPPFSIKTFRLCCALVDWRLLPLVDIYLVTDYHLSLSAAAAAAIDWLFRRSVELLAFPKGMGVTASYDYDAADNGQKKQVMDVVLPRGKGWEIWTSTS